MGKLIYTKPFFYFHPANANDRLMAERAAFTYDAVTLNWITRNINKAAKLRAFADESSEQIFKKHFITHFARPESIKYPDDKLPKTFQIESAFHCMTRSPAYCADEAGLGKTITAILCMNTIPGRVLVICPPYLKYNWEYEFNEWCLEKGQSVAVVEGSDYPLDRYDSSIVIVPDSLIAHPKVIEHLKLKKFTWGFIDEAHRFKDSDAKRTQSILFEANLLVDRTVLLSGTPMLNRPIELFPILDGLAPESIEWRSKFQFGKDFCNGREVVRYEGKRQIREWDFRGKSNLPLLKSHLFKKLMIRHTKSEVLKELPPKTRQIIFLDQPKKVLKYEKEVLKKYKISDLIGEDYHLGDIATYRRECGMAKVPQVTLMLKDLLLNGEESYVIFAHHIDVIETLAANLEEFDPIVIRGGLTSKKKQALVNEFQKGKKPRPIIGNIDAMGVGYTLVRAARTFFVEFSWVPSLNSQAEDRIHRIGQFDKTYHQYFVLRKSLDENMLHAVFKKQEAIEEAI